MNSDFMELLVCPNDESHRLELSGRRDGLGGIVGGAIVCTLCGLIFEICEGILRSTSVNREALSEIKAKEIERRNLGYQNVKDYQLDLDRVAEYDAIKCAVGDCQGQWVLDAGCGVGQTTQVFAGALRGAGIDFSLTGLLNFKHGSVRKMDLIQGDACRRYFREELFDTVLSSQVIEHIPTHEDRLAFISQLSRVLKRTGLCVITTYNWDQSRKDSGMPKEGFHDNGIFYHCYSESEFRSDLSRSFDVDAIWGVTIFLPKTFRVVNALGRKVIYWDRLWRRKKVSYDYGKLLLALCRSKPFEGLKGIRGTGTTRAHAADELRTAQ